MDDGRIEVQFGAQTGELTAGAAAASAAIKASAEGMAASLEAASVQSQSAMARLAEAVHSSVIVSANDLEHLHVRIREFSSAFSLLGEVFIAGLGLERIGEAASRVIELGDELEKLSKKTGVSVEGLSQLRFSATMVDVSTGSLQVGLRKLGTAIEEALTTPSSNATRAFEAAGISQDFLRANSNDLLAVLSKLADRFHATEDGARKIAIAQAVLGRSAIDLIPLLDQGSDGLRRMSDVSDELGKTMSGETAEAAEKARDAFKVLDAAAAGLWQTIIAKLSPALRELAENIALNFAPQFAGVDRIKDAIADLNHQLEAQQAILASLNESRSSGFGFLDLGRTEAVKANIARITGDIQRLQGILDDLNKPGAAQGTGKLGDFSSSTSGGAPSLVQQWRDELDQRLLAERNFFKDSWQEEAEFWKSKLSLTDEGSKEQLAVRRQIFTLEKQLAQERGAEAKKEAQEEIATERQAATDRISLAKQGLQQKIQALDQEVKLGKITTAQKYDLERQYQDQLYQLELEELDFEISILDPQKLAEHRKLLDQKLALEQQHTAKIRQIEGQAALDVKKQWEQALAPIDRAFNEMVTGILRGTQTLGQTMARVFQNLTLSIIEDQFKRIVREWIAGETTRTAATAAQSATRDAIGERSLLGWLGHELAKTLGLETEETTRTATAVAGDAARTASETTAAVATSATNVAEGMSYAGVGAAAAGASVAAIPFVGWSMVPAVSAETYALLSGFAGLASFDVGAWSLPHDMFAAVHAGEMIVPAGPAQSFRDALSGAGPGLGGGEVHVHIHAIDTQTGTEFLARNMNSIAKGLKSHLTLNPSQRPGSRR